MALLLDKIEFCQKPSFLNFIIFEISFVNHVKDL
jgi:hypothetical protein